jgi:amidohydrolase
MTEMDGVIELRRELHAHPELSGAEVNTARRIEKFFEPLGPDLVLTGLGGHGLAIVFSGAEPGPTVLLRCDMDALPIQELNDFPHRSRVKGISHKCGHDGHMAILASVGTTLAAKRPVCGRAVLLFQPAEEDGTGAQAVLGDPRFSQIEPDFVFALHNLPGFPLGEVILREGTICCASLGITVNLLGTAAHAAQPETGRSPAEAMCRIIEEMEELPGRIEAKDQFHLSTVVGARLGTEVAFGTLPGVATVMATVRSETEAAMNEMVERAENLVSREAARSGLEWQVDYSDGFPATMNTEAAINTVRRVASGQPVRFVESPFPWSEDFGHFTAHTEGALFGLGAGENVPELHNPAYDFPEELLPLGKAVFLNILKDILS